MPKLFRNPDSTSPGVPVAVGVLVGPDKVAVAVGVLDTTGELVGVLVGPAGVAVVVEVGAIVVAVGEGPACVPTVVARKEVTVAVDPDATCIRSPHCPLLKVLLEVVTSQPLGSLEEASQALADRVVPTARKRRS
jgi:hypothetical protein